MVISLFSVFVRCHVHSGSSYVCPTVFLTFFPEEVDKFYWPETCQYTFFTFLLWGQFPYVRCQYGSVCELV